jgi:hypothetical protein
MRTRAWIACIAVAVLTSGAFAANASAALTFSMPVNGVVTNDCTGEEVLITGTQHFSVTDNSTLDSLKFHIESNLVGVKGTALVTGARYVMADQTSDMEHADFDPFGDVQMTIENGTVLNRQGETGPIGPMPGGDDFQLHALAHLTVTDGVTRSQKTDLRADCR